MSAELILKIILPVNVRFCSSFQSYYAGRTGNSVLFYLFGRLSLLALTKTETREFG